jgi:tetrahydromethanopterin S-methyltransferase subunit E
MQQAHPPMNSSNPILGACVGLITGVTGLTAMQMTQGVVSIIAGLLTICLLILQIRKALQK